MTNNDHDLSAVANGLKLQFDQNDRADIVEKIIADLEPKQQRTVLATAFLDLSPKEQKIFTDFIT